MTIDGPALGKLQAALIKAFPNYDDLSMMTSRQLSIDLPVIVSDRTNLDVATFQLVQWANRNGLILKLLIGSHRERPIPDLEDLVERYVPNPESWLNELLERLRPFEQSVGDASVWLKENWLQGWGTPDPKETTIASVARELCSDPASGPGTARLIRVLGFARWVLTRVEREHRASGPKSSGERTMDQASPRDKDTQRLRDWIDQKSIALANSLECTIAPSSARTWRLRFVALVIIGSAAFVVCLIYLGILRNELLIRSQTNEVVLIEAADLATILRNKAQNDKGVGLGSVVRFTGEIVEDLRSHLPPRLIIRPEGASAGEIEVGWNSSIEPSYNRGLRDQKVWVIGQVASDPDGQKPWMITDQLVSIQP
jgi:hypothetical protein